MGKTKLSTALLALVIVFATLEFIDGINRVKIANIVLMGLMAIGFRRFSGIGNLQELLAWVGGKKLLMFQFILACVLFAWLLFSPRGIHIPLSLAIAYYIFGIVFFATLSVTGDWLQSKAISLFKRR